MIACNRLLKDLDEWQVNPPFGSSKRSPIISKGGFNIFAPTALSSLFFFFLISYFSSVFVFQDGLLKWTEPQGHSMPSNHTDFKSISSSIIPWKHPTWYKSCIFKFLKMFFSFDSLISILFWIHLLCFFCLYLLFYCFLGCWIWGSLWFFLVTEN